ncbi:neuropeptides capa receptor-like [Brachionus plicatilis]|uniref:Neuropeptides capa receptor-like n=1 Tax=Brachionus plicatilis TaxID=10195 RepID=A0A3M7TAA7_BRAPC|nr:neuropeptides capa receptor-like [Brachionus plicatilis]
MDNFKSSPNNQSSNENSLKIKLESFRDIINLYYLPTIVSIGIVGNMLTILIFTFEHKLAQFNNSNLTLVENLEKLYDQNKNKSDRIFKNAKIQKNSSQMSSSNYFICFLAISDLVYNIILACVWITRIGFNILNIPYICQASVMISYICSFLSAAFTTMFTFQRFMAVVNPLQMANNFLNSKKTILQLTFGLILFSWVAYSFSLFVYDTSPKKDHEVSAEQETCGVNEKYNNLVYIVDNTLDSFLTLVIPAIGITVMNMAICKSLSNYQKENILNTELSNTGSIMPACSMNSIKYEIKHCSRESLNVQLYETKTGRNGLIRKRTGHRQNKDTSRHVTKMLLIVSFAFLVLNSPFRLSKLVSYIHMSENWIVYDSLNNERYLEELRPIFKKIKQATKQAV